MTTKTEQEQKIDKLFERIWTIIYRSTSKATRKMMEEENTTS